MTNQNRAINKLISENKLKEYDTINLGCISYYLNYDTNIIMHNEAPTLTTKGNLAIVLKEGR